MYIQDEDEKIEIQEEIIETPDIIEEVIIKPQPIQEDEIETEFNKVGYYIFKNTFYGDGRVIHISKISKCFMWVNCYDFSDNNFSKLVKTSDTYKIKISNCIKKLGPLRYKFWAYKSVYQEEIIETPDTIE